MAWGGGEKWHLTTAKELSKAGYKTFIVANVESALGKRAIGENIPEVSMSVGNLSFLNPFKIFILVGLFKERKVETIILNLPADLKLAGIAAKLAGVSKIIYRRGMPHPIKDRFLNRFLFKHVLTHVIVNSEEIGRSLTQNSIDWFPNEKIHLIYNGVDPTHFHESHKVLYNRIHDEIIIGNAGRLTEQKGQKYLIEMAKILRNKGIKFKILIAGQGELQKQLEELILRENLVEDVKLLGHVSDMPSFFHTIDLFVFPSLFEGSANTLIESLLYKRACVAFDVSSNPEIIEHEVNGLLAKAFDVQDLTDQVSKLINSKELREKFVQKSEQKVLEKFNIEKSLNQLKSII